MGDKNDNNIADLLRSIRNRNTQQNGFATTSEGYGATSGAQVSEENIAMQLLHSKDLKVAAAAKRIFSFSAPSPVSVASAHIANSSLPLRKRQKFYLPPHEPLNKKSYVSEHEANTRIRNSNAVLDVLASAASQIDTQLNPCRNNSLDSMRRCNKFQQQQNFVNGLKHEMLLKNTENHDTPRLCIENTASKDRLHRRERNRLHARKTRQRKKEQKNNLENDTAELRDEQIKLKLQIQEENTANTLLVMCNNDFGSSQNQIQSSKFKPPDEQVEKLLQRDTKDIPDCSKIVELPALVLPGMNKKRNSDTLEIHDYEANSKVDAFANAKRGLDEEKKALNEEPMEGVDYDLIYKDRSTCTPAELDLIRKERNKMHAKRTRDRKRIYIEEMKLLIEQLRNENKILSEYLTSISSADPSDSHLNSTPEISLRISLT